MMLIPRDDTSDKTYGYKFFEGVNVTLEETDTLVEDENSPILRRNVVGAYVKDLDPNRTDIVVYADETKEQILIRYIKNELLNT